MVDIQVNVEAALKEPAPVRERSVFAIGWVRFKSAVDQTEDDMRVLGLMVVQDKVDPRPAKKDREY